MLLKVQLCGEGEKEKEGVRGSELPSNWRAKEPLPLPSSSPNQRGSTVPI